MNETAEKNTFKVVGRLIGIDGDIVTVETNIRSLTGQVYTDVYPIVMTGAVSEDSLESLIGKKIGIVGEIDVDQTGTTAFLVGKEYVEAPSFVEDFNRGLLDGTVYRFDDMPSQEGKKQLGNVAMIVASKIVNCVTWRGAVTKLRSKGVRQGAQVQITGRLRLRNFKLRGQDMVTIELTTDQSADVDVKYVPPKETVESAFGLKFDAPQAQVQAPAIQTQAASKNRSRTRSTKTV